MPKKLDRYEFIWKAIQVHGYKDDLREANYQNSGKKITIICEKHGKFEIAPYNYLRGHRCQICGSSNITLESFLKRAHEIHNDKFDYSLVTKIENSNSKVKIKCKKCGHIFSQTVYSHLNGKGCPKCAGKLITNEEIIEKIKNIYGDKYDTSKVKYINTDTPITLICKIHGEFEITPHSLFRGRECPKCGKENSILSRRMTTEEFIQKSQQIHKNEDGTPMYDYSMVKYVNARTEVYIICSHHGGFWQKPYLHLNGKGCSYCKRASKLELALKDLFTKNNIKFEYQKHFDWLGNKSLDFYLPDYNIAIECHGLQHFKPIKWYGGEESFIKAQKRDEAKNTLCKEHNIPILYYTNQKQIKDYSLGKLIYNKEDLLKEILKYGNKQ